jgi:hypothetical protein
LFVKLVPDYSPAEMADKIRVISRKAVYEIASIGPMGVTHERDAQRKARDAAKPSAVRTA